LKKIKVKSIRAKREHNENQICLVVGSSSSRIAAHGLLNCFPYRCQHDRQLDVNAAEGLTQIFHSK
jgi:hypothetical protein